MNSNTFIVGNRVTLRPIQENDAIYLVEWINNPEVRNFLLNRFPVSQLAELEWIRKVNKQETFPQNIVLIIETKDDQKPIGIIGLHGINWIDRQATTGSYIGATNQQKKGYATDAKMHLLHYAFETLGLHKIISRVHGNNMASMNYAIRCGYKEEARLREHVFYQGAWCDVVEFGCFYQDWKKCWDIFVQSNFTLPNQAEK